MEAQEEIREIDAFIARWSQSEGNERANFQSFANGLCRLLGVPEAHPAVTDVNVNNYTFERNVEFRWPDGSTTTGRIDLYKKGCFVMEAKQSREKGRGKSIEVKGQPDLFVPDYNPRGQRSANRAWDQLMLNARRQAEDYAKALPPEHGWPPFILVCDVGHVFEIYADFSGQGKNYAQFPDRQSFRIFLEDLRDEKVRERLRRIWDDPHSLDPTRQTAKVTRDIARRLAEVSKGLEARGGHDAEEVALFLMRCLFTMFSEDVGLLPPKSFSKLLSECAKDSNQFVPMVEQLWHAMDKGEFAYAIRQKVLRFNGRLFADAKVLPLTREEIGELQVASAYDWRDVEPAIFGTLLEQALNPKERSRLGAHYTPRAYVERLVVVTVIEPLRQEWAQVEATAERVKSEKGDREAADIIRAFHDKLCRTRVLDPACGTGNFLYVALELMKRLEGDVLEALAGLGQERFAALEGFNVDPHQFLGVELNPRAVEIAELVLWLGYLQWHFRTRGAAPSEPILKDFKNIMRMDAVLDSDGNAATPVKRPEWPEAEFIVGNPPFIGGKDIRAELGDAYAEALWAAHPDINDSADFVMYWWDRAAEIVARGGAYRFGFVTTNSITQVFSRRTVAKHLVAEKPISLVMAIPDHPWRKRRKRVAGQPADADEKHAAVRVAMTVGKAGRADGVLRKVIREEGLDMDEPIIEFETTFGRINSDLTVGVDITSATALRSSEGLCSPGVKLHGSGFIVKPREAERLGLSRRPGLERHIRDYRHGKDLTGIPRGVMVIDLNGLSSDDVRQRYPEVYQHLLETVKPHRDRNNEEYRRVNWWLFGRKNTLMRGFTAGLPRYIATVETAKHRVFQFLDAEILPDNMLVCIGLHDAYALGVLSSRIHVTWALLAGGTLEDRPRYNKTQCFDPFPFPDAPEELRAQIRAVAEELDGHRKARQADHTRLTLTQIYNVLEKLKAGAALTEDEERINSQGLVLILKELHARLDALVFQAYGWPATLSGEEILQRLVDLNAERAAEEAKGQIRWLRPQYQIPKFGSDAEKARLEEARRKAREHARLEPKQGALDIEDHLREMLPRGASAKPTFPTGNELAETAAVMGVLASSRSPVTIDAIAQTFSQGLQVRRRVALTVVALARLGHLSSPDNGNSFTLRRIA